MYADPVDIDLGRHLAAEAEDEAFYDWMAKRKKEQAEHVARLLAKPENWLYDACRLVCITTKGAPYTAEELLIDALDNNPSVQVVHAMLMAGAGSAQALHRALAEHWAENMWETRTHSEISAAIAEQRVYTRRRIHRESAA